MTAVAVVPDELVGWPIGHVHGSEVLGSIVPRLMTPPLVSGPPGPCGCGCALTPETSYGFDLVEFAQRIGRPFDPWQRLAAIHIGELLPNEIPRFRKVLILVARQNGKSDFVVVLALYWLWVRKVSYVLGTSAKLAYAEISLQRAIRLALKSDELSGDIPARGGIKRGTGEKQLWRATPDEQTYEEGSRYVVAAANGDAGRSLTVELLLLDELRQHHDYECWDAAEPTTTAVEHAQIVALSNAGTSRSVVLKDMRDDAIRFIETGQGDERLGILEWSAPPGSSPLEFRALAAANPNLGWRVPVEPLRGEAVTAVAKGGRKLAGFMTEKMCMWVEHMDSAIDPDRWRDCFDPSLTDPNTVVAVDRVAFCLDIAPDNQHATLAVASVQPDGTAVVGVVRAWKGPQATNELRRDLPELVTRHRPRALGWFPGGPSAAVAPDLAERPDWPPQGVTVEEIRTGVGPVCMQLGEQVTAGQVRHNGDELLAAHVTSSEKLFLGDTWRFVRTGAGHVDAAYAVAGALSLARTLPPPPPKRPRSVIV
jgi:hypothetical protein